MGTSVVSICNKALSRLGANRITSLDDGTREANLCKDNYEITRNVVLEEHQWTFATVRYELPIATPPNGVISQYSNFFLIPSEVINIIRAGSEINDNLPALEHWAVEGGYITSDTNKMYVKAIVKIEDPNKYTPMFVQALAIRLAAELAMPITESINAQRSLMQEYGGVLDDAAKKDGQQGTTKRIRSPRYIQARYAGGGSYLGPTV